MLIKSMGSVRTAFKVMACVSFGVLFTCGMIYQTPEEKEEVRNSYVSIHMGEGGVQGDGVRVIRDTARTCKGIPNT